jgi:hypothetical protein
VSQLVMSSPWKRMVPPVTVYSGEPSSVLASVDLPEPLGPMMACTSPGPTVSVTPLRISVPAPAAPSAMATWRSSISNSGAADMGTV